MIYVGLHDALHDVAVPQAELMEFKKFDLHGFVWPVLRRIYGKGSSYITKNQTKIMILTKKYAYLHNHMLQTHLQVLL